MAFLGWFVHYLLIFVVLAAIAGLGIFVGKKLSDKKTAKMAEEAADAEEVK
ncbi:MAG: vanadium nitrogenase [Clostridiales bacterium]|nr:vanadium nitrogenase [Roseburia sp.]MDD7637432.1 vanadium nitrogenase [Clostridiales bacterium]MDY4113243.1 vanadium nitrogenase [Roseburia sp.]